MVYKTKCNLVTVYLELCVMDRQKGIYTLANDNVYDQVIALINSIRSNYNQTILCHEGDIRFINERGWWDEVYLFSYITHLNLIGKYLTTH